MNCAQESSKKRSSSSSIQPINETRSKLDKRSSNNKVVVTSFTLGDSEASDRASNSTLNNLEGDLGRPTNFGVTPGTENSSDAEQSKKATSPTSKVSPKTPSSDSASPNSTTSANDSPIVDVEHGVEKDKKNGRKSAVRETPKIIVSRTETDAKNDLAKKQVDPNSVNIEMVGKGDNEKKVGTILSFWSDH